jgi:hypothetical protein
MHTTIQSYTYIHHSHDANASEHFRWAVMLRLLEKRALVKAKNKLAAGVWDCC